MNDAVLTNARKLYQEGCDVVAEEVKLQLKSSPHIVRIASILKDLYPIFERKQPGENIILVPSSKGFANFRECMMELLRPLDLGERMGFYLLSIGRHLLGKIPEAELDGMPLEKLKQIDRVIRAKGEASPEIIERAKNPNEPAARLREDIDLMLFRGAPDHSDGPSRSLRIVGGKKLIKSIEEKIRRLRPAVAEGNESLPPSDAQVIDFALGDCLAGIQAEEDHHMKKLRQGRG